MRRKFLRYSLYRISFELSLIAIPRNIFLKYINHIVSSFEAIVCIQFVCIQFLFNYLLSFSKGRSTIFRCKANYVDKRKTYGTSKEVKRQCVFGGHWAPGDELQCLRVCPHLSKYVMYYSATRNCPMKLRQVFSHAVRHASKPDLSRL